MTDLNLSAGRDVSIGELVGRDKIVNNIQNIVQRALTAAEAAAKEQSLEAERLAQGVSAYVQRLQARASDTTDTEIGNPYKGLLEYRLNDAENFFGRSRAIEEFLGELSHGPLTLLHAESGAGKTSLLQAGISPRLIGAGHLPLYLRPYNDEPALVVKRAFLSNPSQTPILATAPLRDFLRQVSGVLGPRTTLYIFLDQFEEFWTKLSPTQREEPARDDFIRELAECLADETLNVSWTLSLRTEYFGNLANFRPRIRNPFENDYRLNRLTRAEAQEVVVEPAKRRGVSFEPGLVEQLLDDLGKNEIAPPQIQLVCSALYEDLNEGETVVTRASYDAEGGAAGILRLHLERVLSRELQPAERQAARRLLESLISSEQQRIIRTHTDLVAELTTRGVTPETLDIILNQLIDSRLLRVQEGGPDGTELTYELAHDYLLGEIKLDPDVQARKAAQELLEQEVRAYRRYKTLLTEDRLKVIEPYRSELRFTPEAEQLFTESQAAAQRERAEEEARRQKELEDAHKLAESESRRAEEQAQNAARLKARNTLITGVGVMALIAAVIAIVLGIQSGRNAARADENAITAQAASTQAIAQQLAAEAASTQAVAQQGTAQAIEGARATAESNALEQRDEAEQQARLAQSRQLAAQAANYLTSQDDLALLFSLEAYRAAPSLEARSSLLTALAGNPYLITFLHGHSTPVVSIAFSRDGNTLATGSNEGVINLWDTVTHQKLDSFTYPEGPVTALAFSPDQRTLVVGLRENGLRLVEMTTGRQVASLTPSEFDALAFSPDGQLLAAGGRHQTISLWDLSTPTLLTTLEGHAAPVNQVAFSPDGRLLASSSGDNTVILWDVARREQVGSPLPIDAFPAQAIAFSPDSTRLAVGDNRGTLVLWDVSRLSEAGPIELTRSREHFGAVILSLAFSPDGQWLASGDDDGNLYVWNSFLIQTTTSLLKLTGYAQPIRSLAFHPDSQTLASGYADGTLVVWKMNSPGPIGRRLTPLDNGVGEVAFSPSAPILAGAEGSNVWLWNTTTFGPPEPLFISHPAGVLSLGFSPDGALLAVGDDSGSVTLWDMVTRQPHGAPLNTGTLGVVTLAFSPDGRWLASAGCRQNDGTRCTQGEIYLWEVGTGQLIGSPLADHTGQVNGMAFSPDGASVLASASSDNTIRLWDVADPFDVRSLATLDSGQSAGVFSAAFSPDGRLLLTSNGDGSLTLWEVASRQSAGLPLLGHKQVALTAIFSSDGQTIASGSADDTLLLWDVVTRRPIGLPLQNGSQVYSLAFNREGTLLASSGAMGQALVWNLEADAWQKIACGIAGRNFTQAEWAQYFPGEAYRKTCEGLP